MAKSNPGACAALRKQKKREFVFDWRLVFLKLPLLRDEPGSLIAELQGLGPLPSIDSVFFKYFRLSDKRSLFQAYFC